MRQHQSEIAAEAVPERGEAIEEMLSEKPEAEPSDLGALESAPEDPGAG